VIRTADELSTCAHIGEDLHVLPCARQALCVIVKVHVDNVPSRNHFSNPRMLHLAREPSDRILATTAGSFKQYWAILGRDEHGPEPVFNLCSQQDLLKSTVHTLLHFFPLWRTGGLPARDGQRAHNSAQVDLPADALLQNRPRAG
jgi:hypothetical protein